MINAGYKLIGLMLAVLVLIGLMSAASAGNNEARLTVETSGLIFSHQFHVMEMEVECESCHPDIESSLKANDKNLPTMELCGECHDVDDDENCGMCHVDPDDPLELINPNRPIEFNHQRHLAEGANCTLCHGPVAVTEILTEANMPKMALCMNCHDNQRAKADCVICHQKKLTLADLHPVDWIHQHGDRAAFNKDYCSSCHKQESYCVDCHRGDNLSSLTHPLNYQFTHGLDAKSKELACARCHDRQSFCNDCHLRERRMPLEHSTAGWFQNHGRSAVTDVENCAVCHDVPEPTCGLAGCHQDTDGQLGNDYPIHGRNLGRFDHKGDWHDDSGSFCYQCHTNSNTPGDGFCGYCHD